MTPVTQQHDLYSENARLRANPALVPVGAVAASVSAVNEPSTDQVDLSPLARLAFALRPYMHQDWSGQRLERAFFDLSSRDPGRLVTMLDAADSEEGREALKQLAALLSHGVLGWEYREDVRTRKPYKVFLSMSMGAESWRGLRPLHSRLSSAIAPRIGR